MSIATTVTVTDKTLTRVVEKLLEGMSTMEAFSAVSQIEETLLETPLSQSRSYTGYYVEVFGETYDTYEFVITRRFSKDGHSFIGGASGEVMDLTDFLARLRSTLQATW